MRILTWCSWAAGGRVLLSAFMVMLACPAWATLGDNAASVLTDQARMKGTLHSTDNGTYVVHEITMASGAKVREFVSPAGAVFGVAWDGQFPPDFQQLLGPYYQQVQQASAQAKQNAEGAPRQRRGPVAVDSPGLVFSQTGHVRSFHGQAYIPQMLPQGVKPSDIR